MPLLLQLSKVHGNEEKKKKSCNCGFNPKKLLNELHEKNDTVFALTDLLILL